MRSFKASEEILDLDMHMHHMTDRAVRVSSTGKDEDAVWLPLSQVEVLTQPGSRVVTVTIPTWLVDKHGLG